MIPLATATLFAAAGAVSLAVIADSLIKARAAWQHLIDERPDHDD